MKKIRLHIQILFLMILQIQCSDPDVLLTTDAQSGVIIGTVYPITCKAKINLIKGSDTLARTVSNTSNGTFEFFDIPFGNYTITASTNSLYRETDVYIGQEVYSINLVLNAGNQFISLINYDTTSTLSFKNKPYKPYVYFYFQKTNIIVPESPITINPQNLNDDILYTNDTLVSYDELYSILRINTDSLFLNNHQKTITFWFKYITPQNSISDSVQFSFTVDSTGFNKYYTSYMIGSIYCGDKAIIEDFAPFVNSECEIHINFNQLMNMQSVEHSITISPPCTATYFWNDRLLSIVPSNPFKPDQIVTVTIDTSAKTSNLQSFRLPYSFQFIPTQTNFFSNYAPVNGALNIHPLLPFTFVSPYEIDPVILKNAFHITPAIDSLQFISESSNRISIQHATLLSNTMYTITFDSTLSSCKGTRPTKQYSISFTTAAM